MSDELFYTSAPRGLRPGTGGFCTVAATVSLGPAWQQRLEALSGYKPLYPVRHPQAASNPVAYSHTLISVAGQTRSVLTRAAFAGADHTGRSNKFVHHLLPTDRERAPAGPATVLLQPGVMADMFAGEPRHLTNGRTLPQINSLNTPANTWGRVTGDPAWAAALAAPTAANTAAIVYVIYAPGTDVLALFNEALSLLPEVQRWAVTFNSYVTESPNTQCAWRGLVAGTPAVSMAKGTVIDLTNLDAARMPEGIWAEAARSGKTPDRIALTEHLHPLKPLPEVDTDRNVNKSADALLGSESVTTVLRQRSAVPSNVRLTKINDNGGKSALIVSLSICLALIVLGCVAGVGLWLTRSTAGDIANAAPNNAAPNNAAPNNAAPNNAAPNNAAPNNAAPNNAAPNNAAPNNAAPNNAAPNNAAPNNAAPNNAAPNNAAPNNAAPNNAAPNNAAPNNAAPNNAAPNNAAPNNAAPNNAAPNNAAPNNAAPNNAAPNNAAPNNAAPNNAAPNNPAPNNPAPNNPAPNNPAPNNPAPNNPAPNNPAPNNPAPNNPAPIADQPATSGGRTEGKAAVKRSFKAETDGKLTAQLEPGVDVPIRWNIVENPKIQIANASDFSVWKVFPVGAWKCDVPSGIDVRVASAAIYVQINNQSFPELLTDKRFEFNVYASESEWKCDFDEQLQKFKSEIEVEAGKKDYNSTRLRSLMSALNSLHTTFGEIKVVLRSKKLGSYRVTLSTAGKTR